VAPEQPSRPALAGCGPRPLRRARVGAGRCDPRPDPAVPGRSVPGPRPRQLVRRFSVTRSCWNRSGRRFSSALPRITAIQGQLPGLAVDAGRGTLAAQVATHKHSDPLPGHLPAGTRAGGIAPAAGPVRGIPPAHPGGASAASGPSRPRVRALAQELAAGGAGPPA